VYDKLAQYYDRMHQSLTVDIPYILQLAKMQNGAVLDLGCGSGRVLLPLARAGFQVTGVDNSPEMIGLARAKLAAEPRYVQGMAALIEADIRALSRKTLPSMFDLALITYNSLLHFREAEILRILRAAAELSSPTAMLYIDVANPFLIENSFYSGEPQLERTFPDDRDGRIVEQWSISSLDRAEQQVRSSWIFQRAADNAPLGQFEVTYHYHFPHEMETLMKKGGFRLQKLWGDYAEEPFGEDSERMVMLAAPAS
jgi:SAM-dependent methyltransferase